MQTLVFNTTTKTVKIYSGKMEGSEIMYQFMNIPTVKKDENFYEVMEEVENADGLKSRYPVARVPIANTNMIILR